MIYMHYIKLLRPHQYVKNLFILLPLFFGLQITDSSLVISALIAFLAFSLCASGIYILNDYRDIEEDLQHPIKKNRPLASGAVPVHIALIIMLVLFVIGFGLMISLSIEATIALAVYIGLNIAYSFKLKHVAVLDVTIIATGFVLRLIIGSIVTSITLSMWIVVMTFLLALFLALAKRRDDVLILLESGKKMRKVIDGYNLQFLDSAMTIMASVVIVAYIQYTTTSDITERLGTNQLYITTLFVILGIMRYLQIAFIEQDSGNPTKVILTDKFILLTLAGWLASFTWILYL